jgi:predicted negative regulator of RcsB-dependent stress response
VPERDDRTDDRQRPARPAWATVPTMSWSRVVPQPDEDEDIGEQPRVRPRRSAEDEPAALGQSPIPVSPAIVLGPPLPRGTARPAPPAPADERRLAGPAQVPTHEEHPASVPPPAMSRGARQVVGPPGQTPTVLRSDLADLLTAPTPPRGVATVEAVLSPMTADGAEPAAAGGMDPEQILMGWEWAFDPETLRETVDDREGLEQVRDMLTAKLNAHSDNPSRARLLSLRAVVSRILDDLKLAHADGKLALAHAEQTGELRRVAIAQARLAHVLQWQGEFEEADRLFALANSTELPDRLRATMHQHAGKSAYDQGRYIEACNHFEKALELRKAEDPEMIAYTELALDAVFRMVAQNGWGPYPRTSEEILRIRKAPTPALDEATGKWGFTDPVTGETCIPAKYADVQPFKDGAAWVQRPGYHSWELIDEAGATLIPTKNGYVGVSSFSDGLAWVSRDGNASWIAVDKANNVAIPSGFDDVRPFRRGMAAVRRGGRWGAVDGAGRVVVPFGYDAFATAMSDGRYIDGFNDEGLAVVELNGRKGVVDRTGRVLVEPVHPALVIHPVAFLITDGAHRWGALDRHGRVIIRPSHPSRMAVTEEIDRLLADTRPML